MIRAARQPASSAAHWGGLDSGQPVAIPVLQVVGCIAALVALAAAGDVAAADELTVRVIGVPIQTGRPSQALKIAADGAVVLKAAGMAPASPINFLYGSQEFPTPGWQSYRPDEARKLLAEVGYPNGVKLLLLYLDKEQALANSVAAHLAKAGFTASLSPAGTEKELDARFTRLRLGSTPAVRLTASRVLIFKPLLVEPQILVLPKVPDVVGRGAGAAENLAAKVKLKLQVMGEGLSSRPAGQVFRQNPAVGSPLPRTGVLQVWLSLGPEPPPEPERLTPDLTGLTPRAAENRYRALGLIVQQVEELPSGNPAGVIVAQEPGADTPLPSDRRVRVTVASTSGTVRWWQNPLLWGGGMVLVAVAVGTIAWRRGGRRKPPKETDNPASYEIRRILDPGHQEIEVEGGAEAAGPSLKLRLLPDRGRQETDTSDNGGGE